jgi:hypothetical protein
MRRLIVLGVMVFVGVAAWQIGNKLSSDAISMALGLVFGVLSGVPAALLVLATSGRRRSDAVDVWDDAYQAGIRDVTALALGALPPGHTHTPEWIDDGTFSAEWMEHAMAQRAKTVDGALATRYSVARPFGLLEVDR